MPEFIHNGTALVPLTQYVHNGTALVPVVEYVHNGTALVPMYANVTDGPVPVVASNATWGQSANVATTTVTLPTGLAAGDFLVMPVSIRGAGAFVSVPGWTAQTPAVMSGGQSFQWLTRQVADATDATALSGSTVTVTCTSAVRQAGRVIRVTGARTIDVVGTGSGSTTTTANSTRVIGPVTTTGANRLLLAAWYENDATVSITVDAAMTSVGTQSNSGVLNTSNQALVVASQTIAAAGSTGTRTGSYNNTASLTAGGQLLAFAPVYV